MDRMLDEYLDFARGEGGEKAQLVDLGEVIRDVAEAVGRAHSGDKTLVLDIPPGTLMAVKPQALRRCLSNLIDNAMKHGRQVRVTLSRLDRMAEIHVDDDGPGIAPEQRDEAMKPFRRLDEGRNLQSGGVGLGLAIANDIARAHGGELVLGDSPDGGLRATVRLPL
jgi:two-component system osmolarity sensor histidine kinase EnvZ